VVQGEQKEATAASRATAASAPRTGRLEGSCEFADLFGSVPAPLSPYLPSFRHALVDLPRVKDLALSTEVRLRAFLKALKYIRRPDSRTASIYFWRRHQHWMMRIYA